MVKEGSVIISGEQAKRIALEDVNAWRDVKSAKVESIEKIHDEDDEFSQWEVNGIYVWDEGLSGSFTLGITEEGKILTRLSFAYPVPEGRTVPGPSAPKYHCVKCDAIVNLTDEKCPNGHVLKDVGIKMKLLLEDKITLSDQLEIRLPKIEENLLKRMSNRIKKEMEKRGIDSITIKLPFIDITFDERSQDAK